MATADIEIKAQLDTAKMHLAIMDQLAVHAPPTPLWDFTVHMPHPFTQTRPEPRFLDAKGNVVTASQSAMEDPENWKEIRDWDAERKRQRIIQWPWVWAAAVLSARPGSKAQAPA